MKEKRNNLQKIVIEELPRIGADITDRQTAFRIPDARTIELSI